MKRKIILTIVLIIVAFHVAWYAASWKMMHKKPPDESVAQAMFDNFLKNEKISIDRNSYTETSVEANGIRLHLDIFQPTRMPRLSCLFPALLFILNSTLNLCINCIYKNSMSSDLIRADTA